MAESALERYFDKYIANDPCDPGDPGDPCEVEDLDCDVFSLPDDLLALVQNHADKESSSLARGSQTPETPETPENQPPHILPTIQNVVSTLNLGCFLDLNLIAHRAWNVEYNPKVIKVLTMRIRKPPTTAMFYSSGKMVCLGAKSVQYSYLATRRFGRIVQQLGFPVRFLDFQVVNIVASGSVPPVRLERLAQHRLSSYEPELFPALFLKGFFGISVTVFPSGKILLIGAKTEERIQEVFSSVVPFLSSFRRP